MVQSNNIRTIFSQPRMMLALVLVAGASCLLLGLSTCQGGSLSDLLGASSTLVPADSSTTGEVAAGSDTEATSDSDSAEDCGKLCHEQGKTVYDDCITAGGTEDDCHEQAKAAGKACMTENNCQPPEQDACNQACHETAEAAEQACLDSGKTVEECDQIEHDSMAACVKENACPPPPKKGKDGEKDPCSEACHVTADAAAQECVDSGKTEEECEQIKRDTFDACVTENACPPPPKKGKGGEQDACGQACHETADSAVQACVDSGKTEEECQQIGHDTFDACVTENGCQPPKKGNGDCPGKGGMPM